MNRLDELKAARDAEILACKAEIERLVEGLNSKLLQARENGLRVKVEAYRKEYPIFRNSVTKFKVPQFRITLYRKV